MRTTRYFEEQVLRKRPYIRREWCERALRRPSRASRDPARWSHPLLGFCSGTAKYLRVVTLEDGETVHNAFPDRDFAEVVQ